MTSFRFPWVSLSAAPATPCLAESRGRFSRLLRRFGSCDDIIPVLRHPPSVDVVALAAGEDDDGLEEAVDRLDELEFGELLGRLVLSEKLAADVHVQPACVRVVAPHALGERRCADAAPHPLASIRHHELGAHGAGDVRSQQGRKRNPEGWSFSSLLEMAMRREKVFATLARMRGCLRACGLLGALKGRLTKSPPESMSEMAPFRVLPAFQPECETSLI